MKLRLPNLSIRSSAIVAFGVWLFVTPCSVRGDTPTSKDDEAVAAFDKAVAAAKEELIKSLTAGTPAATVDPTATPPAFRFADAGSNAAVADFAKAMAAAKDDLIKKLEGRLGELTKAGNLDEAIKVRDAISKLKAKPAPGPATPAAPAKAGATFMPQKDVAGTWLEGNGTAWVFAADGTFTYAGYRGTWVLNETGLVTTFKTGWPGQVRVYNALADGMLTGHYSDNPSKGLSMKRADPK